MPIVTKAPSEPPHGASNGVEKPEKPLSLLQPHLKIGPAPPTEPDLFETS